MAREIPSEILSHRRDGEPDHELIMRCYYAGYPQSAVTAAKTLVHTIVEDLKLGRTPGAGEIISWLRGATADTPDIEIMRAEVESYDIAPEIEYPPLQDGEFPTSSTHHVLAAGERADPTCPERIPQEFRREQKPGELLSETILRLAKRNRTATEKHARKIAIEVNSKTGQPVNAAMIAEWLLNEWQVNTI